MPKIELTSRTWKHIEVKCKLAHSYITSGRLTPTNACKKARLHYNTYTRWLMTRNAEKLIRAVLNSNLRPGNKREIVKRLGG